MRTGADGFERGRRLFPQLRRGRAAYLAFLLGVFNLLTITKYCARKNHLGEWGW